MDRETIATLVEKHAALFRSSGATGVYLYGSRARGDYGPDSDLDLFIDYDPARQVPSYFRLIEIEQKLAGDTGMPVSITTRQSLHPLMKDAIERDAIRLM